MPRGSLSQHAHPLGPTDQPLFWCLLFRAGVSVDVCLHECWVCGCRLETGNDSRSALCVTLHPGLR